MEFHNEVRNVIGSEPFAKVCWDYGFPKDISHYVGFIQDPRTKVTFLIKTMQYKEAAILAYSNTFF